MLFRSDVVKTNITLKAVEDYAGDQLSETERQVRSLQSVVDGVNGVDDAVTDMATARGLYEAAQSALENNWYQDELDKLTEIEIGISGLKDAFYSAGSEVVGAGGTSGIIETTGVTSISVVGTPYDDIYPDWVKAAGVQSVFDYMESGAIGTDTKFMTPQGEVDTLANIKNNSAKLPGFALGGLIDGPASGYNVAATFHGPEVITPLADYMAADG